MAFSIAIPMPADASAPFNAMRDVRITTVRVWLRGNLGKQAYLAIITHCGKEQLQAPSGPVMTVTHVPQKREFRAQLGEAQVGEAQVGEAQVGEAQVGDPPKILGDGTFVTEDAGMYMQVGPFATWNIEIAACQNADGVVLPLDLSKLEEVHLSFLGKFRTP
jgi:hypothetical protein